MFARRLSAPPNMALYLSGVHSYVALFSFQRSSAARKRKMREAHRSSRRLVYLNKLRRVCQALFSNTFEWEEGSLHVRSTACLVYPTLPLLSRGFFTQSKKIRCMNALSFTQRITTPAFYSTVTLFARFLGLSTSFPLATAA